MAASKVTNVGLFGSTRIPKEGLKAVGPEAFDWSTKGIPGNANAILINLRTQQTTAALISQVLAMYVDNSAINSPITFLFDSGQQIIFPAKSQGYLSVAQGSPVIFSAASVAVAGTTNVHLLNYEPSPYIWSTP